jgi:predicted TIM-barrel fold metal-dependent hydrolase
MNRRQFLAALAATPLAAADTSWGGPVIDIHLHPRRGEAREIDHLEGSGVGMAVLLPGGGSEERAKTVMREHPKQFVRFTNFDVRTPEAADRLRAGLKGGAIGIGELKYPVQADGPEMRKVYEIAAEFHVPVLLHFEEGGFNSGIGRLPDLLKTYPKTTFVGHANSWWANISADRTGESGYPGGRVKPGGITDRVLADYPNIFGDLSANSGRNALARDPEFTAGFLQRHANKLMFGSDCTCTDGRGAGQSNSAIPGKCFARETLALVRQHTSPAIFRKIVWENAVQLYRLRV